MANSSIQNDSGRQPVRPSASARAQPSGQSRRDPAAPGVPASSVLTRIILALGAAACIAPAVGCVVSGASSPVLQAAVLVVSFLGVAAIVAAWAFRLAVVVAIPVALSAVALTFAGAMFMSTKAANQEIEVRKLAEDRATAQCDPTKSLTTIPTPERMAELALAERQCMIPAIEQNARLILRERGYLLGGAAIVRANYVRKLAALDQALAAATAQAKPAQ